MLQLSPNGRTPRFRAYIAASLDGYIATPDGGVRWLRPFEKVDYGYDDFLKSIGTIIIGRKTYEQALGFGAWPYANHNTIIVSRRALTLAPGTADEVASNVPALIATLRAEAQQDVWVLGGAQILSVFLEAGALDSLELFIMPVALGDGIPLFEKSELAVRFQLLGTKQFSNSVVLLSYSIRDSLARQKVFQDDSSRKQ